MFSYEICEIFKNTFFDEHLRTTAFSSSSFKLDLEDLTVFQDLNLRFAKIKLFTTVFLSNFSSFCSDASSFLCYQVRKLRNFLFSMSVFFHEHSRITGLQGKGEGISPTPHYHFHPLHRHLDISRAITAESYENTVRISKRFDIILMRINE